MHMINKKIVSLIFGICLTVSSIANGFADSNETHSIISSQNRHIQTNDESLIDRNPLSYDGEYQDADTELVYLRARIYNPEMMSFIQRDSYHLINRYNAFDGNPVNNIDPNGHFSYSSLIPFYGAVTSAEKGNWGEFTANMFIDIASIAVTSAIGSQFSRFFRWYFRQVPNELVEPMFEAENQDIQSEEYIEDPPFNDYNKPRASNSDHESDNAIRMPLIDSVNDAESPLKFEETVNNQGANAGGLNISPYHDASDVALYTTYWDDKEGQYRGFINRKLNATDQVKPHLNMFTELSQVLLSGKPNNHLNP
ncbi:RHS repeat-associated core domain-containing protein [Cysteiniphilum sp. JM-1]|uniref:RHS repeat-associated core domain-containing protein n=1 Tax=Cysteiniphilum sp. JM-1 TaxID=2610891 RepID=UPI001244E02E|nr:RHS repeat-associated core domain-containing protein [Cysteiniphilum sp. JM-1]